MTDPINAIKLPSKGFQKGATSCKGVNKTVCLFEGGGGSEKSKMCMTSFSLISFVEIQGRIYFDFFLFSPGSNKGTCASELDIVDTLITSG